MYYNEDSMPQSSEELAADDDWADRQGNRFDGLTEDEYRAKRAEQNMIDDGYLVAECPGDYRCECDYSA